jgi:hypothetical protein
MRFIDLLLAVVVAVGLGLLAYLAASLLTGRRGRRARWQVRHYGERGCTVVAAALTDRRGAVLDEHVVARIPDHDPAWAELFVQAKGEAEERTFHLNA